MSFGKRLLKVREALSLSQKEMAKLMGVSERIYLDYEKDKKKPTYEKLLPLSSKSVNLHWLLTGEGEMFINKEGHGGIPSDRANIHPELYNFLALLPEEQQKQLASVFKEVLKSSSALSSGHTSPLQQERQAEGGRIAEEK